MTNPFYAQPMEPAYEALNASLQGRSPVFKNNAPSSFWGFTAPVSNDSGGRSIETGPVPSDVNPLGASVSSKTHEPVQQALESSFFEEDEALFQPGSNLDELRKRLKRRQAHQPDDFLGQKSSFLAQVQPYFKNMESLGRTFHSLSQGPVSAGSVAAGMAYTLGARPLDAFKFGHRVMRQMTEEEDSGVTAQEAQTLLKLIDQMYESTYPFESSTPPETRSGKAGPQKTGGAVASGTSRETPLQSVTGFRSPYDTPVLGQTERDLQSTGNPLKDAYQEVQYLENQVRLKKLRNEQARLEDEEIEEIRAMPGYKRISPEEYKAWLMQEIVLPDFDYEHFNFDQEMSPQQEYIVNQAFHLRDQKFMQDEMKRFLRAAGYGNDIAKIPPKAIAAAARQYFKRRNHVLNDILEDPNDPLMVLKRYFFGDEKL